jgi:hypothetical protein
MKRRLFVLAAIVIAITAQLAFSQTATPAPAIPYSVVIASPVPPVPGMPIPSYIVRCTGDYTIDFAGMGTIGPYANPFTVNLQVVYSQTTSVSFASWVIDGANQPIGQQSISVTADNSAPTRTVYTTWLESPPTVPPTPGPSPAPGQMWIEPATMSVRMIDGSCSFLTNPDKFITYIKANTGTQVLAAYSMTLTYLPSVISLDNSLGGAGTDVGSDGFISSVNTSTPGTLAISGFDSIGKGPGASLNLLYIHWVAVAPGTTPINLTVGSSTDPSGASIGTAGVGATITILPSLYGDVNNSGTVDIIDALLVSQYYVGLAPGNFNSCLADVNKNGSIDIVDALLIARYYVGLISSF